MKPDFCIYPSLLNAFQNYLDCEANYEKFYGFSENPSISFPEYDLKQFRELIDTINRVPFESEAADKGTCFNEIIDCIVLGKKSTRDDVEIRQAAGSLVATMGERTFYFDANLCKKVADRFMDAIPQYRTEAIFETKYGKVLLYGYLDYLLCDVVYDVKTTGKYEFGKYKKGWQQYVYPWTLIESKRCTDIKAFEYTAVLLKGGTSKEPLITGEIYPEVYTYSHEKATQLINSMLEHFIEFLNNNKALITDKKVFGGVND